MSPQGSRILAETEDSVNRLVYGAEALLQGYRAFLELAGEKGSPEVQLLRDELPLLISRFETLQKTIQSGLERIILPMHAAEEGRLSPGIFRQWLADCHKLQSDLQALNPKQAEQVRSVHELIFALHQRFVNALAPVTLASGQGRISSEKKITYVDCTTSGGSVEKAPLLRPSDKAFIEEAGKSGTVVSTDDALIVNLKLGTHMSVIELLEQADGGKGRTLRLKLSDEFNKPDKGFKSGKLKRMWFLAQFLKAIELDENSDPMKISCNAVAGEITIECPQMKSRKTMQNAFEQLLIVINGMFCLDTRLGEIAIFGRDQWDFNVLAQHLNCDVTTEADRFAFQHSLFSIFYVHSLRSIPPCYKLLSNHQQFIHHAHRLGVCHSLISFKKESKGSFREMFMSDEMSEDIRREILQHLVLLNPKRATRLYEDVYPDLKDKYFVITPTHDYKPEFVVEPVEPYRDHNEQFAQTLLKHGLKYASKRARRDYCYLGIRDHSLEKRIMTK
ncbi:hypothetical protein [Endozoicomonas sp. 8E]|uniref:hypothetical protein n=1 Tax=Endozoicomonas sp. 8E TaxID=3035692 RepID=UPI0029393900|nr:hypothetical protein [Endozoicomonas sp. 8E]WOG28867.1 hypothetical protein P6910_04175 [Endozoicomonas sp. 8E]